MKYKTYILLVGLLPFFSACGGGTNSNNTPASNSKLLFEVEPSQSTSMTTMTPFVEVHILDGSGNIDTTASNLITLSLDSNPSEVLIHQSGGGPYVIESIELDSHVQLSWSESQPDSEVGGMAYDPASELIYLTTIRTNSLYTYAPKTEVLARVGIGGTLDKFKGISFEGVSPFRLFAVTTSESNLAVDSLYSIDTNTGTATELGQITPNEGVIAGFNGLATDPTDNTIYAISKLNNLAMKGRALMRIDSAALTATNLGDTGQRLAGIAFSSDGTLYAISGERSPIPESLFSVNKSNGALTLIKSLDIIQPNSDGEAITIIPSQLTGTTSVTAENGIAKFKDIKISGIGQAYTLLASSNGLNSATSLEFDVVAVNSSGSAVTLNNNAQTVNESDKQVSIAITIAESQTHDVIATLAVSGTADGDGIDHELNTSKFFNITIPANTTTATRVFDIVDDSLIEAEETIVFTLLNASFSTISPTTEHTVTIVDND